MDANRDTIPDTYAVVNDWATTLLGMAGADKTWLLGDSAGPAYGNDTWKYIENSVTLQAPSEFSINGNTT